MTLASPFWCLEHRISRQELMKCAAKIIQWIDVILMLVFIINSVLATKNIRHYSYHHYGGILAKLTVSGLKKSGTYLIELNTAEDAQRLNDVLADLTDQLIESGELSTQKAPNESVRFNLEVLENNIDFGCFSGRLLCDLTAPSINKNKLLFEQIGFPTDDPYYNPFDLIECAVAYEYENYTSGDEPSELDSQLDELLSKFDEIMVGENPFLNNELSKKATKLAFHDWDPDLNTEVDIVIYLRGLFPNEVGQAALNQSEEEGEEIDIPTLGRVAELIATDDEKLFLESIENFYKSLGYKK